MFGFDIGHGSIKIVQLDNSGKKTALVGYGSIDFNPEAIKDGEIIDFDTLSSVAHKLIESSLKGSVITNRIAASLPVLRSFSRIISLPIMEEKDILEAVKLEAEQYIPVPINELYLDYQLLEKSSDSQDLLLAAAPKKVVDSYLKLFGMLGLELVCMEPSILSVARIVHQAEDSSLPTLVIDCGSITTDLFVYNQSAVRITGTIKFGGDTITQSLMNEMGASYNEARSLKTDHGLDAGEKQAQILKALSKDLDFFISEIKKITNYFEERDKDQNVKVEQVIILGGGANLPGISTYLTSELRVPTRLANIWEHTGLDNIQTVDKRVSAMYATAAGLALIDPEEAVK